MGAQVRKWPLTAVACVAMAAGIGAPIPAQSQLRAVDELRDMRRALGQPVD